MRRSIRWSIPLSFGPIAADTKYLVYTALFCCRHTNKPATVYIILNTNPVMIYLINVPRGMRNGRRIIRTSYEEILDDWWSVLLTEEIYPAPLHECDPLRYTDPVEPSLSNEAVGMGETWLTRIGRKLSRLFIVYTNQHIYISDSKQSIKHL